MLQKNREGIERQAEVWQLRMQKRSHVTEHQRNETEAKEGVRAKSARKCYKGKNKTTKGREV